MFNKSYSLSLSFIVISNIICKFSKSNTEVGPLLNASDDLVKDMKSMSNMLLKQFSSVFSSHREDIF